MFEDMHDGVVILMASHTEETDPGHLIHTCKKAFWDQTESGHATGYVDLGWLRPAKFQLNPKS